MVGNRGEGMEVIGDHLNICKIFGVGSSGYDGIGSGEAGSNLEVRGCRYRVGR